MNEAIRPSRKFIESLSPDERKFYQQGGVVLKNDGAVIAPKPACGDVPNATMKPGAAVDPKLLTGDPKLGVQWVPPALIISAARAFTEGRIKYGPFKWRETQTSIMTYVGGALRHLLAYADGEDVDPESTVGKLHLDGAVASLAILLDCLANGTVVDDRPGKGKAGELLRTPCKPKAKESK